MRSIQYILGGRPKCFADCVDYAKNHEINNVTLALKERTDYSEDALVDQLIGVYMWDFDDRVVTYEETYRGIVEPEDEEREALSRDNANHEWGIEVENDHLRF
ncbi:MAG: hypothetical protein ACOC2T_02970 [Planctomycetota bacterium]